MIKKSPVNRKLQGRARAHKAVLFGMAFFTLLWHPQLESLLISQAEGGRSSSRSSSSSSSSSRSWGRSSSSFSYSKPAVSSSSSSSTSKPAASSGSTSSGGYSKPAASSGSTSSGGYSKPAASSGSTSSGGYGKPAANDGGTSSSGGYGKPSSTVTPGPAPKATATDLAISRRESASALDQMRQKSQGTPPATTSSSRSDFRPSGTLSSTGALTQTGVYRAAPVQSPERLREMAAQQLSLRRQIISSSRQTPLYQGLTSGQTYTREGIAAIRGQQSSRYPAYPGRYHGSPLFDSSRQYGSLDPSFLMGQLYNNNRDNRFWYGLLGMAGVAAFLSDATDLAAATGDNELLERVQLAKKEAEALEKAGQPRPDSLQLFKEMGVPPEVAFRPEVLTNQEDKSLLRFATGDAKGVYYSFCNGGKGLTGLKELTFLLKTQCLQTQGSQENLDALIKGEADAILVQADVADLWLREDASRKLGPFQVTLMQEPFWLLVNEKSDIDELDDLEPDRDTLFIGMARSGTSVSWHNLLHHSESGAVRKGVDSNLSRLPTRNADPMTSAKLVAEDPKNVMLMVMGMDSPLLEEIAKTYGKNLKLIPFGDSAFKKVVDREDNPVYRTCTIPGGRYPSLQEGWFSTSVDTLCVDTVVVLSEDWAKRNGEAEENSFLDAANQTIAGFQARQLMKK